MPKTGYLGDKLPAFQASKQVVLNLLLPWVPLYEAIGRWPEASPRNVPYAWDASETQNTFGRQLDVVADATPACQKTIGAAHEITSGLPVIQAQISGMLVLGRDIAPLITEGQS
jgi:hypothetical protein